MTMTVGDLIHSKKQAEKGVADAKATVDAAERAHSAAMSAVDAADGQLNVALAKTGPVFVHGDDGSVEIFLPGQGGGGHTRIKPVADTTPVDLSEPAPVSVSQP